jgi:hypothetical protein
MRNGNLKRDLLREVKEKMCGNTRESAEKE